MNNVVDSYSAAQMTQIAEKAGTYKATKNFYTALGSAIIAGAFISLAFIFYITVTTGAASAPYGLVKFVGGICFSMGLMLVVACGVDLFTSTILTIISKVQKKITWRQMFNNWGVVYLGNLIGALIIVAFIWFAGQHNVYKGSWGVNVLTTANYKLQHSFVEAVFLGIFANLMVCMAVWLNYAGRSLLDKMLVMILPVAMFVASGFEHSIANMFMIPMGIVIKNFAAEDFWQTTQLTADQFDGLTVGNFIMDNLIPVTIGNIIGGLLVGLSFWMLYLYKKATKN